MERFNHYTLNTGHSKTSYPTDVDKGIYFIMRNYVENALNCNDELMDFIDGTKIKLTAEGTTYVCSLYDSKGIPFLMTAGCCDKNRYAEIYGMMADVFKRVGGKPTGIAPMPPFVLDLVLPNFVNCIDKLEWTADFCQCLGWMIMSPESVR